MPTTPIHIPTREKRICSTLLSLQYFKSIEKVAREAGHEQILPPTVRAGNDLVRTTRVDEEANSPTILSPQPATFRLVGATPATEYTVRSGSPELVPDRMASRIPEHSLNKAVSA